MRSVTLALSVAIPGNTSVSALGSLWPWLFDAIGMMISPEG